MRFSDLGLDQLLVDALVDKGYKKPTPIQIQAIPAVIANRNVMANAQTGSGKTAGFTLPILQRLKAGQPAESNSTRALILAPTRELAVQIGQSLKQYGKNLELSSTVVYGGVKINPQMMCLRKGVDILVATPGRLLDLVQQNAIRLNACEIVVLDEADRMLDMGFIDDIRKIFSYLPKKRQTLMFSATYSPEIRSLAKSILHNPREIEISPKQVTTKSIKHLVHPVDKKNKAKLLSYLIEEKQWKQLLVFVKTKRSVNQLVFILEKQGKSVAPIHGDKSQGARLQALESFKSGQVDILVATDLASRGLDISELPLVINYDLPKPAEVYVHRTGRTGRANRKGLAISLVSADEVDLLSEIESLIGMLIKREYVSGFEPKHEVPATQLKTRKKKKPKKTKSIVEKTVTSNSNRKNKFSTKKSHSVRKKSVKRKKQSPQSLTKKKR